MNNDGLSFKECKLEIPAHLCLDLKADVSAEFYEIGGTKPVDILDCTQASYVEVKFDFSACGPLKRLLCGHLCLCVGSETLGPGKELKKCKTIRFSLCDQDVYTVRIDFPANYFCQDSVPGESDCGTVICLALTGIILDDCEIPKPVGIGLYCKGPCLLVMPPNPGKKA